MGGDGGGGGGGVVLPEFNLRWLYPRKDDLQIIGRKCLQGEHVEKKQIWERLHGNKRREAHSGRFATRRLELNF